jgi:hypothetical protein
MTNSTLSNEISGRGDEQKRGGAESLGIDSPQINAEAPRVLNARPGGLNVAEDSKEMERKLRKQQRNRLYYSANIERLREKARDRYYLAREKEDALLLFVLLILSVIIAAILITDQKEKKEATVAVTPSPPAQNFIEFDIGEGKTIKIKATDRP